MESVTESAIPVGREAAFSHLKFNVWEREKESIFLYMKWFYNFQNWPQKGLLTVILRQIIISVFNVFQGSILLHFEW